MPVVRYFKDGGLGITQNSVRFFFRAAEKIVRWNNSSARPVRIVVSSDGFNKPKTLVPFTMRIEYASEDRAEERYVILLSGTQAGYGGEGPTASATILRSMGIPNSIVGRVFERKMLEIDWNEIDQRWEWIGPFEPNDILKK